MSDCKSDFPVVGMQHGEQVVIMMRFLALCISLSIVFPWFDKRFRAHLGLFFIHWLSGVAYVMTQFMMSVMILNCWSNSEAVAIIYILKLVELVSLNLWSLSSLAIGLLIAVIVKLFSTCRRVPTVIGSRRVLLGCIGTSIAITATSALCWNMILVTGGYYWVDNDSNLILQEWITFSFAAAQVVAGLVMLASVIYVMTSDRRANLRACFKGSNRVKYYFILTIVGTVVNLYNGMVSVSEQIFNTQVHRNLVILGWISKYVHVIGDTIILVGALRARQSSLAGHDLQTQQAGSGFSDISASRPAVRQGRIDHSIAPSAKMSSSDLTLDVARDLPAPAGGSTSTASATPSQRAPENAERAKLARTGSFEFEDGLNSSTYSSGRGH